MRGLFRIHITPHGEVAARAFRLEDSVFRAEVQREGDPLAAVRGVSLPSLEEAWQHAEATVVSLFPHDCGAMHCGAALQRG